MEETTMTGRFGLNPPSVQRRLARRLSMVAFVLTAMALSFVCGCDQKLERPLVPISEVRASWAQRLDSLKDACSLKTGNLVLLEDYVIAVIEYATFETGIRRQVGYGRIYVVG